MLWSSAGLSVGNLAHEAPSSHFPPTQVFGSPPSTSHSSPQVRRRLDLGCTLQRPGGLWKDRTVLQVTGDRWVSFLLSAPWEMEWQAPEIGQDPPSRPAPGAWSLRTGTYCGGLGFSVPWGEGQGWVCFRGGEVKVGCVLGRGSMAYVYWVRGSECV